jgi:hypothetical protein
VKDIFHLLEADFNPLELCTKLAPLLEKLPGLNAEVSSSSTQATMLHLGCTLSVWLLAAWTLTKLCGTQCCAGGMKC